MKTASKDDSATSGSATELENTSETDRGAAGFGSGNSPAGVSIRVTWRSAFATVGVIALILAVAFFGWRFAATSNELDQLESAGSDGTRAEQIALDYATGAAQMDYQDLGGWRARLVAGTSPELTTRLQTAGDSLEQIITPLQWSSTSSPVAAKVQSSENGIYVVDCFVRVNTKNTQVPDGVDSTATYRLSIDTSNNWAITDVSGLDAGLAGQGE